MTNERCAEVFRTAGILVAARLLGLSRDGSRINLYGQTAIGAQTAIIVDLLEKYNRAVHSSQKMIRLCY
jgi:hypothetical protein